MEKTRLIDVLCKSVCYCSVAAAKFSVDHPVRTFSCPACRSRAQLRKNAGCSCRDLNFSDQFISLSEQLEPVHRTEPAWLGPELFRPVHIPVRAVGACSPHRACLAGGRAGSGLRQASYLGTDGQQTMLLPGQLCRRYSRLVCCGER